MELITDAFLMVGGEGRRMRPYTETIPKPMLPVGGIPLLQIILQRLSSAGIKRFLFGVNYLHTQIMDHFGDGTDFDVDIQYVKEPFEMGTVGSLTLIERPDEPFLLMNGDVYTDLNFSDFFYNFRKANTDLYILCKKDILQGKYGVLELKEGGLVTAIQEKPQVEHVINCGIYVMKPEAIDLIPKEHYWGMDLLVKDMINAEKPIGGYLMPQDTYWNDIGNPSDYHRLLKEVEGG